MSALTTDRRNDPGEASRTAPARGDLSRSSEDAALITHWIMVGTDPGSIAEARVRLFLVPVWALAGYFRADDLPDGWTDAYLDEAAQAYGISLEAAQAALTYYRLHRDAVNFRMDQNGLIPDER